MEAWSSVQVLGPKELDQSPNGEESVTKCSDDNQNVTGSNCDTMIQRYDRPTSIKSMWTTMI